MQEIVKELKKETLLSLLVGMQDGYSHLVRRSDGFMTIHYVCSYCSSHSCVPKGTGNVSTLSQHSTFQQLYSCSSLEVTKNAHQPAMDAEGSTGVAGSCPPEKMWKDRASVYC